MSEISGCLFSIVGVTAVRNSYTRRGGTERRLRVECIPKATCQHARTTRNYSNGLARSGYIISSLEQVSVNQPHLSRSRLLVQRCGMCIAYQVCRYMNTKTENSTPINSLYQRPTWDIHVPYILDTSYRQWTSYLIPATRYVSPVLIFERVALTPSVR